MDSDPSFSVEDLSEGKTSVPKRPLGITLLAILFVAGAGLGGILTLLTFGQSSGNNTPQPTDASSTPLIIGLVFIGVLVFVAGIGMWRGHKWGWWCAAFYYLNAIARDTNAMAVMIPSLVEQLPEEASRGSRGPGHYFAQFAIRVVVHSLLLLYIFKPTVMAYFGLAGMHRGKAIASLIAAC